jgi:mannosyltransferase
MTNPRQIDVIAPNFKRRLSGVTSTIIRLVPLQARSIAIAATGPVLPPEIPQIPLWRLPFLGRSGPSGARVWHARRNVEMLGGLALKYLLFKRLRLVFTSASQREHTWLTRWLIRQMDDVIATSAKTASYLTRPAHVIHHGIDTDTFCPSPDRTALRRSLNLPDTGPLIGCYGRIRAQKGTDVFVDAMAALLADHPTATALVMGRATEKYAGFEQGLKDKVAALGLATRILFLPEVPVWEMAKWYQALDLYIAPQRWEGFGLTPLEAMACGVPCIATTVGAFEELVAEGATGTLIPPGDVAAMTTAARNLLSDPEKLGHWSVNARKHVLDRFRLEHEAEAIIAVYRAQLSA